MALRVSFYCAVFLRLSLCAESLKCYTLSSCVGGVCGSSVISTDLEETTCPSGLDDVCLSLRTGYTNHDCYVAAKYCMANGERTESTVLTCSADYGLKPGCFNFHELPSSVAAVYSDAGYDTFEYCLCDQDLCNNINFDSNNNVNGNNNAESLICNSKISCTGPGCGDLASFTGTDLQESTCASDTQDVCVTIKWTSTVNGERTEAFASGCGGDYGLGTGCFNFHDLPTSATQNSQGIDYDTFEYCVCDRDRCNNVNDDTIFDNGSTATTFTLFAIVWALLVTLGTILGEV